MQPVRYYRLTAASQILFLDGRDSIYAILFETILIAPCILRPMFEKNDRACKQSSRFRRGANFDNGWYPNIQTMKPTDTPNMNRIPEATAVTNVSHHPDRKVLPVRSVQQLRKAIQTLPLLQHKPSGPDAVEHYYDELFRKLLQEVDFLFQQYLKRLETKPEKPFLFIRQRLEVILETIAESSPELKGRFESALTTLECMEKRTAFFVLGCLRLLEETSWRIGPLLNRLEEQGRKAIDRLIEQTEKSLITQR